MKKTDKAEKNVFAELKTSDVHERIGQIEKSMVSLRGELEDVEKIEDDADYEVACGLLVRAVKDRKWLDDQKEEFERAAKAMLAVVKKLFEKGYADVDAVETPLREKVEAYVFGLHKQAHALRVKAAAMPPEKVTQIEKLLVQAEELAAPKVGGISYINGDDLEVFDLDKVPNEFTTRVVNKKALLTALQSGRVVAGVRFIPGKTVKVTPKNAEV